MTFIRRRTGLTIVEDEENVPSDCNQITFANNGDVDITISIVDQGISYLIGRYQTISFGGEERPDIKETNLYDVSFAVPVGVETKSCSIERMNILQEKC